MMKKLLLSGLLFACALSAGAMDEERSSEDERNDLLSSYMGKFGSDDAESTHDLPPAAPTAPQTLKFQVNKADRVIEDSPNGSFFSTFKAAVHKVHSLYDIKREKYQKE